MPIIGISWVSGSINSIMVSISVVTVVRNNANGLTKTLDSLLLQGFRDWECNIVVGESEDESLVIAETYSSRDQRINFMKEESKGIYGAMNDGILMSRGQYLNFMNAGDVFANNKALELLYQEIKRGIYSVVIGNFVVDLETTSRTALIDKTFNQFNFAFNRNWGNHQAMMFARRIPDHFYNKEYKIASDFDYVLRHLAEAPGKRIPYVVARIESGGVSDFNLIAVYFEKFKIRNRELDSLVGKMFNIGWTAAAISKRIFMKILALVK